MMQMCEEKGCWLVDLQDVPAAEYNLWMAYYDWKAKEAKRSKQIAETEARLKAPRH